MRYLGAAAEVVPFWNRIPAFFRYPFRADPLIVIAICTLVPLLLSHNIVGLLVSLLLALALFKYAYAVVSYTAEGHLSPPPLATAFTGSGFHVVILQLLVFIVMGGLVYTAGLFGGELLALVALAFVVLILPASVMILAMEQSVGPAVNPAALISLVARIGWPYFVLYAHLILLMLVSGVVQEFAFTQFAPQLARPIAGFVSSTFFLIFFHMMGYLLFQYQEELGFASDHQDDETTAIAPDKSRRVDADIDISIKDGNYDRALVLIKAALKKDAENPVRIEQLYRLLSATNQVNELHRFHPRILQWQASRRDGQAMASTLAMLENVEPDFRPNDPELAVNCAQLMFQTGEFRRVLRLLQEFHKRFPESEHLAPAYLLIAQSLGNGLGRWEKATAFLNFIKQRCKDHPLHGEVDNFLAQAGRQEPITGVAVSPRLAQF